ncbi:aminoglycoside N-acetyltransferase AAC(3)-Ii [Sphingopyxis alaskensis]|jgi:aminoglycoside 3-N-acetyltransferase I|uniref:Gentamicin 3'-N-acetyltransferase n=1 Tax=Sphingopyxis alaskensis (strain DSM 13593 / LMG 18877 / RB2256) TaxID=317655 RepID=Q1GVH5_SPHAL|nr:aminoglycoside N-acetyltransferase AAC(3)-Ii [Sphingopyxis alaskensis]ABF52347.1 Gentamicin 3'-N-acetyltransferase [Sphingopyxis alaskensis RB2256]MCM3420377.1 aminoglycoside N-acetyltransferase AAC(3)-Ii [Sphingopyxis alaskensis]
MIVRRLGPGDIAAVRALNAVYGAAFDDPETYRADRPDDAWLARQLGREGVIVLVAELDGNIVGGLTAYELPKLEAARSEIYLYDLAVDAAHRRCGIATALIGELQHIAAETGAWAVFVQADHGDDPAVALYTGLGAREDVMHFDLPPRPRGA